MPLPNIVLSSQTGQTWSAPGHLRIGRLAELEVHIDDPSVSRIHAEVYLAENGWVVRDRGSSNGTHLNGVRLGRTPAGLSQGDVLLIGSVRLNVAVLNDRPASVRVGNRAVQVEASAAWSWEANPEPGEAASQAAGVARLVRAALRLAHGGHTELALQTLVNEARRQFAARRCGLFLSEPGSDQLALRCFAAGGGASVRPPGRTLAAAAMRGRQSLLFTDPDVAASLQSESALRGELGSVICAVLRTPDGEVGVFHLDRARGEEPFTAADLYLADTVAAAIALGLDRPQLVARHQTTLLQSLASLASAIGVRDGYTDSHTRRLIELARLLGEELGLSAEQRRQLQVATALHDVGMIAVEDYILFKPSKLQPNELEQMKAHVTRGVEIVRSVPGLEWAVPVVRGHHEQWDGTGYPDGLAGDEIPLASRILAVVDAFESLTSDRPYRKGVSVTRALGELQTGAGSHFDPNCVAAFLRIRPRIEEVLARDTAEEA